MPEAGSFDPRPDASPDRDGPLDPHFRMAPAYAGQLAWTLGAVAVVTAACLVLGWTQGLPGTRALGLHLLLVTGVLAALWRMVALRGEVSLEREARAEARRKAEQRARAGKESLFAEEPEDVPRHWTTEYKLEGYAYIRQRIVLLVPALAGGLLAFLFLFRRVVPLAADRQGAVLGVGALEFAIGFACVLASRYFALVGSKGIREARALAGWLRSAQWLAFAAAVSKFVTHGLKYRHPVVDRVVCYVILAWTVLCALELALRTASGLFGARRGYRDVEAPVELIAVQMVFATANPVQSLVDGLERYLGISLQASWGLRFLGRSFIPLVFVLALLMWLMTALEVVHPHELGLLEHWGRLQGEPLKPGLHLKWPWPVDRVRHYPAEQLKQTHIGFELESPHKRLEFVLWTKRHAEEYRLILNEAKDLLSLAAYIHFRVKDVKKYAYRMRNPDEALETLAYAELMRGILPYDLDVLLGRDRAVLPRALKERIQAAVDRADLGLEIVEVTFVGLHPPLGVADAYQEVVSAQIEFETMQRREEAFRALKIPAAEAEAIEMISDATAYADRQVRLADGEAEVFSALLDAYRQDPWLFRATRHAEAYERAMSDRRIVVIDEGFEKRDHRVDIYLERGLPLPPLRRTPRR